MLFWTNFINILFRLELFQIQDLLVDGAGAFLGLLLLQEKRLVGLVTRR